MGRAVASPSPGAVLQLVHGRGDGGAQGPIRAALRRTRTNRHVSKQETHFDLRQDVRKGTGKEGPSSV